MAMVVSVIVGVALGLSYSRKGLFAAATALVSVFVSAVAALIFARAVVGMVGWESDYAYGATMAGLGVFVFVIISGTLVFVDKDVDFHPLIERLGGALAGLATGLVLVGFACVCLMCMPQPQMLRHAEDSTRQATVFVLLPCHGLAQLLPGWRDFDLEGLQKAGGSSYSPYGPPPPPPQPPAETTDSDSQKDVPTSEEHTTTPSRQRPRRADER